MSERANQFGGNVLPPDSPSPSQLLVAEVAAEVRGDIPYNPSKHFNLPVDAHTVRQSLAESSLGDLLVSPGEKLEAVDAYQDVRGSVTPGEDTDLGGVSIATWYVHDRKRRIIPAGEPNPYMARTDAEHRARGDGSTEVTFPGQYDWRGDISVTFWHRPKNGSNPVGEILALQSTHWEDGKIPIVESRVLIVPENPENGSTYYPRMSRPARDEAEVTLLAETIRSLIPPPRAAGEPPYPASPGV